MKKVNINTARKAYNSGIRVIVVPCKVSPYSILAHGIQKDIADCNFDELVNAIHYYNCNSELGRRLCYYIEE